MLLPLIWDHKYFLEALDQQFLVESAKRQKLSESLFGVCKLFNAWDAQLDYFHFLGGHFWVFDQLKEFLHHFSGTITINEVDCIHTVAFQ